MNILTREQKSELWYNLRELDRIIAKIQEASKYEFIDIRCRSWYTPSKKLEEIEKLKRQYREKDLERKQVRNRLKGYDE